MSVTDIGAIRAQILVDTSKFKDGMDRAKRDLTEVGDKADKTTRSFAGLESALTAIGASAALVGLVRTVRTLTNEAHELSMSMTGLSEVAKALGHDVGAVTKAAEQLASRGFMTVQQSADALKTTLATGYGLDESIRLINALSDAAAFNRESHLEWGEAVVQAARGIKMQNSNLTDAAGITTNLSVMYDKYAKSIGKSAATLTEAEKAQAAYNGMIEEAALFTGNADKALAGYAGTQATFNQTIKTARAELGEAYLPIIEDITKALTKMIAGLTGWATENKEVVAGVTAGTVAVTGLVAVLTTLVTVIGAVKIALDALKISLGPIGWLTTALGLAAAGLGAFSVAANMTSKSVAELTTNQEALNAALDKSATSRSTSDLKAMETSIAKINELLQKRAEIEDEIARKGYTMRQVENAAGQDPRSRRLIEFRKRLEEVDSALEALNVTQDTAAAHISNLTAEIEKSTPALRELRMEELREIAAKQDVIAENEKLIARYNELAAKTKRTAEENEEMTTAVRHLSAAYPQLATELDTQGGLLITNETLIRNVIAAEKDALSERLRAEAENTASRRRETAAALEFAKKQVIALNAAAGVKSDQPWVKDTSDSLIGRMAQDAAGNAKATIQAEVDAYTKALNEIEIELAAIENGTWRGLLKDKDGGGGNDGNATDKGTKAAGASKTAEQLAQEAYRTQLQIMEKRRLLGQLTEQQEADTLGRLAKQYEKYDEIWIDAESRRQRVVEQMAAASAKNAEEKARASEAAQRASYEKSAEWIEMETRRMTERGESELAITQMQLEAWARVRSRYTADTDYYKRADKAMYDARMQLRRMDEQTAIEAAKNIEAAQKETTKASHDAISKQRDAELAALDERKRATQKYYDDLLRIINESERGRERKAIEEEATKYRNATSEKGKKRYAELMEELRKMDVEDSKQALQDERDAKLAAYDEQKRDIDAWYNDLKAAADAFNGNMIALYQLTEDKRLAAFVSTNSAIKAEMQRFMSEMEALNNASIAANSVVDPFTASTSVQMEANAKAWHTADAAGKERLATENLKLGASIGATKDSATGKWYGADGTQLFHEGRNGVTGGTFSAGDMLMPDEITAILRDNEYVFTPGQLRSLLDGVGGRGGGNTYIEKVVGMEVNDAVIEDEIDMRALGRTGADMAAEMARNNYTGGGG